MRYAVLILILLAGTANAEQSALECKYKAGFVNHIKFDIADSTVILISGDSVRKGSVEVTDTHYRFVIPPTDKTYEARITVNRHSGEVTYEFGDPPFNELNPDNVIHEGKCDKASVEPTL